MSKVNYLFIQNPVSDVHGHWVMSHSVERCIVHLGRGDPIGTHFYVHCPNFAPIHNARAHFSNRKHSSSSNVYYMLIHNTRNNRTSKTAAARCIKATWMSVYRCNIFRVLFYYLLKRTKAKQVEDRTGPHIFCISCCNVVRCRIHF